MSAPPPPPGRGRGRGLLPPHVQQNEPQEPQPPGQGGAQGPSGPPTPAGSATSENPSFSGAGRGRGRGLNLPENFGIGRGRGAPLHPHGQPQQQPQLAPQPVPPEPQVPVPEVQYEPQVPVPPEPQVPVPEVQYEPQVAVPEVQDEPRVAVPEVPDEPPQVLVPEVPDEPQGAVLAEAGLPAAMEALQIGGAGRGMGRGRGRGQELQAQGPDAVVGTGLPSASSDSASKPSDTHTTRATTQTGRINVSDPSALQSAQRAGSSAQARASMGASESFVAMRGTKGDKVTLTTNFLILRIDEEMGFFEYHVDFVPQCDSVPVCKKIIYNLKVSEDWGPARTFDGAKLCLPRKLPSDVNVYVGDNPNEPGTKIKIIVKFVKEVPLIDSVHFYNILLRKVQAMTELTEINRNYFDSAHVHQMPEHRLEIWSGYDTAIDRYEGGLMVCVETLHRVLRNTTILEYLRSLRNTKPDWQEKFHEAVVGRSILTRYNNRFYKVDDIEWKLNPMNTFPLKKTGQQITFVDYFKNQYGAIITDLKQPLLISRIKPRRNDPTGETKTILLIPELSYMTGLTEEITSNFNIMKDLIAKTRITPIERLKHINDFIKRVTTHEAGRTLLASWGLSLDPNPVQVEGRKIEGPGIRFNERTTRRNISDNDFARQATSAPCFRPVNFKKWVVFTPAQERDKATKMVEMIRAVVTALGITYTPPEVAVVQGTGRFPNGQDYAKCIRENTPQAQFVIVILAQQRDELYAAVKKQCLVNSSIPSQVIMSRTLGQEKRMKSIMQKVVLQINCKLGGALWGLDIPKSMRIMFVGIDAYHDPKRKNKSVLAMVAGLDNECSEHLSRMAFQAPHQEGSAVIGPLFQGCLEAYYDNRGYCPDRVVVFRDGVGDGQMRELMAQEIEPIKSILAAKCPKMPAFSFVVVQKRINERIFKTGPPLDNPSQGTVVDHTITRFQKYDFFLISQLVRQGTVGPTHYTVLDDGDESKADVLQKFAYALTFMYYNWPGTIRVPAVCQYAHKLAYLVGQHVMAVPMAESDRKLYYL